VVEIIEKHAAGGVLQRELAAEYGVDQSAISLIVRGKKWAHILLLLALTGCLPTDVRD
jgi:transcriptional regulator with XRE-family HTH domain